MPTITPPRIDYTNKDYQSLVAALLEVGRERLPDWTDQSANDPGVVLTELFAYMGDIVLYYIDRALNEGFLDTAVERRSLVSATDRGPRPRPTTRARWLDCRWSSRVVRRPPGRS